MTKPKKRTMDELHAEQKRLASKLGNYENKWVAVKGDSVLLACEDFNALLSEIRDQDLDIDSCFHVQPSNTIMTF